jgi:hypothetical protein
MILDRSRSHVYYGSCLNGKHAITNWNHGKSRALIENPTVMLLLILRPNTSPMGTIYRLPIPSAAPFISISFCDLGLANCFPGYLWNPMIEIHLNGLDASIFSVKVF